jgi:hypothetical protein
MICGRRRNDKASTEVDCQPKSRVLLESAHSSARRLSKIEDARLYPTQQVQNSEKDRPTPMEESTLK